MHAHHIGHAGTQDNRREIGQRIERQLRKQRLVDRNRRRHQQQRITIRRRPRRLLGADIGRTAGPVIQQHRLAPHGDTRCATMRPIKSALALGAKGTMIRTGLAGKVCAMAAVAKVHAASAAMSN
jgi:hypothetical protein